MCLSHVCTAHLSILTFCFPRFPQLWDNMQFRYSTLNSPLHSSGFVTDTWQLWKTSQGQDWSWNKEIGKRNPKTVIGKKNNALVLWILFYWVYYKYPHKYFCATYNVLSNSMYRSQMVLQLVRLVYISIILLQRAIQHPFHLCLRSWVAG